MEKINRKAWDKVYEKEGKIFINIQRDMPKIVKLFKKNGVKRVLDLGCGTGRHLIFLAGKKFDVYGFDISEHGIKIAKKWLKRQGLKANFKVGNIYKKLPYKNNYFDAIISTQTLHHGKIIEIRKLLKEMKRILKPNGLIFITVRKHVSIKHIPKNRHYGIKYIAPRTYIILGGPEKDLPHFKFNKNILRKEFNNFRILDLWIEKPGFHYCLLGRLRK
jgi:ubiquinone/menaquinone biosynthesis C-methylase UbiE